MVVWRLRSAASVIHKCDSSPPNATLNQGNLHLNNLAGSSDLLSLSGGGTLDLQGRQRDMDLTIRGLQGWKEDPRLMSVFTFTSIQLRVYASLGGNDKSNEDHETLEGNALN